MTPDKIGALIVKSIFSILMLSFAIGVWFYEKAYHQRLIDHNDTTTCVITEASSSYLTVEFYVKDKKHQKEYVHNPSGQILKGEAFKMLYNSDDVEQIKVLYQYPLLLDTWKYAKTTGKIVKAVERNFILAPAFVVFQYRIADNEYERVQDIINKITLCDSCLYLVKYNKERPEQGYIFVDSLVYK